MKRRYVTATLIAAVALWFLAVDRSWFVERCPACRYGRDVLQFRILTIPLSQRTQDYVTLMQKVAEDMGAGCSHPALQRYHKHRYWGLCICAWPCINGTDGITEDLSWYDDRVAAKLKDLVRADPSLRDQLVERVIKNHDWDFWKAFLERLRNLQGEPAQPQN